VDDNPRYRHQLCRLIGRIAPTAIVFEAENTSDALRIGEKAKPNLGLIDVVLEDEDGIMCASRLKKLSPLTRMILISAYPDREFRRRALSVGAIAFLDKKDLDMASVRQVIEDALR
jgi:DNA-binding NarL/FixJ family response regulator